MIEEIRKYDKDFNEATFISKVDHIFIMILNAIMDNNIDSVKHYLSNDVYKKYNELVTTYKQKGLTRLFDEMNIKKTEIINYNIINNNIIIIVKIDTRYMDYFIDSNGDYVSGINNHRIQKEFFIKLKKPINSKGLLEARRCNNCGKTLDINDSGICPYCKQVINIENNEYIVIDINEN